MSYENGSIRRRTGRAIVVHEDQVLLMERWRDGRHYYSIPGGGIEAGETPEAAAQRELVEEMGVYIVPERPLYKVFMDHTEHIIFLAEYLSGEPKLQAGSQEWLKQDKRNRFKPVWIPKADIGSLPLGVWEPLKRQLAQDLAHGFSEKTLTFHATLS